MDEPDGHRVRLKTLFSVESTGKYLAVDVYGNIYHSTEGRSSWSNTARDQGGDPILNLRADGRVDINNPYNKTYKESEIRMYDHVDVSLAHDGSQTFTVNEFSQINFHSATLQGMQTSTAPSDGLALANYLEMQGDEGNMYKTKLFQSRSVLITC